MSELPHQTGPDAADVLSEDSARAVLRRAVQLQAESAQEIEQEAHLPASSREPDAGRAGFSVSEVEAAAAEVGIAPEFVKLALLETRSVGTTTSAGKPVPRWLDRTTTLLIGSDRRTLVASRTIGAPPTEVFEAMQRVFPPMLTLKDVVGDPAASGGILSFDVASASSSFGAAMFLADIQRIEVAVYPVPGELRQTQIVVRAGLDHSRRLNRWLGTGASTLAAAAGGGATASFAGGLLGLAGATIALPAAAGAGLAGILGVAGFRRLYRWGLGRGLTGLDDLIRMLDVHMRTGGAFAAPSKQAPPALPPPFIPPPPAGR